MTDFHNYEWKLRKFKERLHKEAFSERDRNQILEFIEHSRAQGVSAGRLYKLAWSLLGIRRMMPCAFQEADRKAIERLVADINSVSRYSPNTKSDLKKIVKRFYKYVRFGNADRTTPFPPEVAWMTTGIKRNEVREPDILTEEEAKAMIEAAPSTIDKALISLLYEGGLRISEALGMRVRDLIFDEAGAKASVSGKTGCRTVRLISSAPLLAQFLDQHPMKSDESAPLWYYFPTVNTLKPLNYRTASMIARARAALKTRVSWLVSPRSSCTSSEEGSG